MSNIPWKIFNHNDVKILRCRFILVFSDIGENLINHHTYIIYLYDFFTRLLCVKTNNGISFIHSIYTLFRTRFREGLSGLQPRAHPQLNFMISKKYFFLFIYKKPLPIIYSTHESPYT